jgi:hypothetical protein
MTDEVQQAMPILHFAYLGTICGSLGIRLARCTAHL